MKGVVAIQKPKFLQEFIAGLDLLALKNFPVTEVSAYLSETLFEESWLEPYTFFSEKRYTRNLLHKLPEYEILLLCWMPHQVSPIHGHEGEKCWMRVEAGALHFTDFTENKSSGVVVIDPLKTQIGGRGFVDGPAFIHQVANRTEKPAMSLHLYARPFAQCDIFDQEHYIIARADLRYDSIDGKLIHHEL